MKRRRTPIRRRSIKSVLSNPRPKSRRSKRKAPRIARRNPRRSGRVSVKKHSRSRAKSRRSASRRKTRSNPKAHTRMHRRNPAYRLSSKTRSGWKRVNPRSKTRRNPARRNPAIFKKVPVVGGLLGTMFGTLPAGILAGVSTEIPLRLSPMVMSQSWIPAIFKENEWVYFTVLGALSGAGTAAALRAAGIKSLPLGVSVASLPGLMTAAASGAGWVQMRARQLANAAGVTTPAQQVAGDEPMAGFGAIVSQGAGVYGALTASPMGMGPAYDVAPGGYGYGGALVAAGAL